MQKGYPKLEQSYQGPTHGEIHSTFPWVFHLGVFKEIHHHWTRIAPKEDEKRARDQTSGLEH